LVPVTCNVNAALPAATVEGLIEVIVGFCAIAIGPATLNVSSSAARRQPGACEVGRFGQSCSHVIRSQRVISRSPPSRIFPHRGKAQNQGKRTTRQAEPRLLKSFGSGGCGHWPFLFQPPKQAKDHSHFIGIGKVALFENALF
jgi:hypothetical protein